ncbi:M48 family metallopeptidase [Ferrimonas senticii]|uniref:M48 family metallopeptidase n=1 Tax=Ferrimonas senticii TaxID=394566 RepID=UPI000405DEF8|nr:M48 family metallopeptidase [Ferrimonas senticii]
MDFFAQQQQARRRTLLLLLLFAVAVILILAITNIALALFLFPEELLNNTSNTLFSSDSALLSGAILLVISAVIIIKWQQLRAGGHKVAEALGGKRIATNSDDPTHRRLLNVVEEMALAAGLRVPAVYLLPHEYGINAFAAGYSQADAVIGVTQGTLDKLTRSQLQGVIAHEYSHILNGDMRLNLRLMAVLAGIIFISQAGEFVARASSNSRKNNGQTAIIAIALMVLGYLGTVFANLIKAAVNRQREFLADASAVQFTRDPSTIAGALKMIAAHGSRIDHANAAQSSHLLFGSYRSFSSLLATHPPIEARIRAIEPNWDGRYAETVIATEQATQVPQSAAAPMAVEADNTNQKTVQPLAALTGLSTALQALAHQPQDACELAAALVGRPSNHSEPLQALDLSQQTALVQLLNPSLLSLSPQQSRALLQRLQGETDTTNLQQWCLLQLLSQPLRQNQDNRQPHGHGHGNAKHAAIDLLLLLANHGNDDEDKRRKAFYRGANAMGWYQAQYQPEVDWQQAANDLLRLRRCPPVFKQKLLRACVLCAQHDDIINADEAALLHCLELLLDLPPVHANLQQL